MNKLYLPISKLQLLRDIVRRKLGIALFDKEKNNLASMQNESIKRIVFLRWDAKLGDSFVSSSSFNAIRRSAPDCKISVITTPAMSDLFTKHFGVDEVLQLPKRPKYKQLNKLAKDLGEVDLVIALNDNMKMKDIYFLNLVKARHIASTDDRLKLVDIKLGTKTKDLHFSGKFKTALEAVGIQAPSIDYTIPLLPDSQDKVKQFLSKNEIAAPFLALNPFGSGHSRKLSTESVQKLIHLVHSSAPELPVVIMSSPDTRKEAEIMSKEGGRNVFHFGESENIFDIIALIESSEYVASVDTATVHIASGLNKPQFCIYNFDLKNFTQWGPNSEIAISVFSRDTTPPSVNYLDWDEVKSKINLLVST
ncbi:lipopolysaccharide heptosyltransferase family protein [Vibrio sp. JC009]|uniref:glycosyltransferase family 9 protein n=1 Tax=Vibrio sp. JC009 TaxID=2912314 RepID=UPI0023B1A335|nr:glycosyltransferase family 9 protein [Vibrio sp. JC009]WED21987.1 lipopolysaccharide heptosyltransferase family protein [Vibrio sp. JC009]